MWWHTSYISQPVLASKGMLLDQLLWRVCIRLDTIQPYTDTYKFVFHHHGWNFLIMAEVLTCMHFILNKCTSVVHFLYDSLSTDCTISLTRGNCVHRFSSLNGVLHSVVHYVGAREWGNRSPTHCFPLCPQGPPDRKYPASHSHSTLHCTAGQTDGWTDLPLGIATSASSRSRFLLLLPPCTASSGCCRCCWSPSRWTRRCGSTTRCSWAFTCSASCWRGSPAPSVPSSSSPPSSSSATAAGGTASCTTARTQPCPTPAITPPSAPPRGVEGWQVGAAWGGAWWVLDWIGQTERERERGQEAVSGRRHAVKGSLNVGGADCGWVGLMHMWVGLLGEGRGLFAPGVLGGGQS